LESKEVFDYLSYDPDTGIFTWVKPRKGVKKSKIAGRKDQNGYITICFNGTHHLAHRLAWFYTYGVFPDSNIDHKNKDRSDNRIENLRLATVSQNGGNQKHQTGRSSKYKGVSWHKRDKVWRCNFKSRHVGTFLTEELAAEAYNERAKEFYGEFASLNELP